MTKLILVLLLVSFLALPAVAGLGVPNTLIPGTEDPGDGPIMSGGPMLGQEDPGDGPLVIDVFIKWMLMIWDTVNHYVV